MSDLISIDEACYEAAELISQADGLIVTAGAGVGVDSGMPDFRGDNGFWTAYPALREREMRFYEIANPKAFRAIPSVAWGFYGHRLALYRDTTPHHGFNKLNEISSWMPNGAFVFTATSTAIFKKLGSRLSALRSATVRSIICSVWPNAVSRFGMRMPFCQLLTPKLAHFYPTCRRAHPLADWLVQIL